MSRGSTSTLLITRITFIVVAVVVVIVQFDFHVVHVDDVLLPLRRRRHEGYGNRSARSSETRTPDVVRFIDPSIGG